MYCEHATADIHLIFVAPSDLVTTNHSPNGLAIATLLTAIAVVVAVAAVAGDRTSGQRSGIGQKREEEDPEPEQGVLAA